MSHEWCPRVDCTKENVSSIQPYADISGNGVVIGFFGTAYFVLLLVIADYVRAFDPDEDPFQTYAKHGKPSGVVRWHPNPVDDRLLKSFRKTWHLPLNGSRRFRAAFNESIITMCDIQVVTGLGILITSYILLPCGLDAYHWQLAVYIAWFSAVTHLSGLTVLRTHLNTYVWAKYVRFSLMLSLLVLLVVGMVPTGFFSQLSAPAVCYFKQDTGTFRKGDKAQQDQKWQAMVLSVFLLIFGFVSRSVKLFRPLSASLSGKLRQPVGSWAKKMLRNLAKPHSSNAHLESLRTKLVFKPILAAFFMFRLSFDLYSSTLFEVSTITDCVACWLIHGGHC
ncbi:hypothetical protein CGCA056_v007052 [Colletotrichum aenigma]|uniref:uncharacterized protein n=1 Tax=Colletotrichum aenigma TaxID=1215731 RepID=UPI0018730A3A|nr:uncharacterized protein CGCA056_v007052 [Colletotrichum aenigma]KAF5522412.1 hypothetical protein CGCA056_v007052 [Colletotrichum aenigma]